MAKAIILCGKIASGKSYYATKLKDETGAIILSVDNLMLKLSDSCLGDRHDEMALRCERFFYELAEQIVMDGIDVIIDFGYWSKRERDDAKQYFQKKGISAELHYIKIPEKVRMMQLEQRNAKLIAESEQNNMGRVYIIGNELRQRLDLKFEEPLSEEIDVLIS